MTSCLEYAKELSKLVANGAKKRGCDCLLLSGGVDTTFVATSLTDHGVKYRAITVVFLERNVDERYSRKVSSVLGIEHDVLHPSDSDVEECLKDVLKTFRTIDPIEVVCDIPMCIGLRHAKELGCKCVLTGDGGDELFLGYSFLLNLSQKEIERWLEKVMTIQRFSAEEIGGQLGIRVIPGLFLDEVKRFSTEVPIECKIAKHHGRTWGKYLLRILLDRKGLKDVAWREKAPINLGSGSVSLIIEWSEKVDLRDAVSLSKSTGILFPSLAHTYLYKRLLDLKIDIPKECDDPEEMCPVCGRCMKRGHCEFCGAHLGSDGTINVYTDGLLDIILRERKRA